MKTGAIYLGLLACLVVGGCSREAQRQSPAVAEDFHKLVQDEVTATIHAFMAGFSAAKCSDVSTVSKLVRDNMIYATANDIFTVSLSDYEQGLRERACGWVSHTGVVDSVTVDALSRDIAAAAWKYHDEVKLKSGEIKRYKGITLMTLVRSVNGWVITSTMSSEG